MDNEKNAFYEADLKRLLNEHSGTHIVKSLHRFLKNPDDGTFGTLTATLSTVVDQMASKHVDSNGKSLFGLQDNGTMASYLHNACKNMHTAYMKITHGNPDASVSVAHRLQRAIDVSETKRVPAIALIGELSYYEDVIPELISSGHNTSLRVYESSFEKQRNTSDDESNLPTYNMRFNDRSTDPEYWFGPEDDEDIELIPYIKKAWVDMSEKEKMASKVAAALYPVSVDVRDLDLGTLVRANNAGTNTYQNDMVGIITHLVPATQKVWVSWGVGRSAQHSPEELTIVPPGWGVYMGKVDSGYDSYEKEASRQMFGWVDEDGKVHKPDASERRKMASNLTKVIERGL